MSLLDGLLGNASNVNAPKAQKEMADVLMPDETVEAAFRITRADIKELDSNATHSGL